MEELPPHKGILNQLNEAGGKALSTASLTPEVKHKLDSRLKEANHRWIKVRNISNEAVVYMCDWEHVLTATACFSLLPCPQDTCLNVMVLRNLYRQAPVS